MVSKNNKKSSVLPKSSASNQKNNKSNKQKSIRQNLDRVTDFKSHKGHIYTGVDTGLRRFQRIPREKISPDGLAFLKCAFAPPDFIASSVGGVPDEYRGPSLTRKHRSINSVAFVKDTDTYMILAPVPGIAYYSTTVPTGTIPNPTTQWNAVAYSDFVQMFGVSANTTAASVNRFRFISNHFELISTVNEMMWSGNIQAWKLPLQFIARPPGLDDAKDQYSITGLDGVLSSLTNCYSGPFAMGVYSGCYSMNPAFQFSVITEDIVGGNVPKTIGPSDWGQLNGNGNPFTGFDNGFESLCIKVSGVSLGTQSALIKTWACVEYGVVPNSVLYAFISLSPCDAYAMKLYREIITNLPVGVPSSENENFWNRVLGIMNMITGATSMIPGPIGLASTGLNFLGQAGQMMIN